MWLALTSKDNPRPLNKSHYALAVGAQAYCMGGAGIYTAPTMAGPWSYQGSLYNQMVPEPEVGVATHSCFGWAVLMSALSNPLECRMATVAGAHTSLVAAWQ